MANAAPHWRRSYSAIARSRLSALPAAMPGDASRTGRSDSALPSTRTVAQGSTAATAARPAAVARSGEMVALMVQAPVGVSEGDGERRHGRDEQERQHPQQAGG